MGLVLFAMISRPVRRASISIALTREARRIMAEGIPQREVAERIGLHPTDLSKLMNGVVGEFSQERLERALYQLGCVVQITVSRAYDDHQPTTTEFQEEEKGILAPGKLADLAVLSQDIFTIPVEELPRTESVLTLIGGKVVWNGQVVPGVTRP